MKGDEIEKFDKNSDNELLEIISKNDENLNSAFSEIYKRYSKRIFAFCKHQTNESDFAQIAYQESWIALYKNCIEGKKITNISAFLIAIARRKIIDFIRKENTSPILLEFEDENFNTFIENKNEILDSVGLFLEKGLNLLNDDMRKAFILKRINLLNYKEIAEITGYTVDCLKKRVSRAEVFLKNYIRENIEK